MPQSSEAARQASLAHVGTDRQCKKVKDDGDRCTRHVSVVKSGSDKIYGAYCGTHGGARQKNSLKRKLRKKKLNQVTRQIATPIQIDPGEAILQQVWESAGIVAFLREKVKMLNAPMELDPRLHYPDLFDGDSGFPPEFEDVLEATSMDPPAPTVIDNVGESPDSGASTRADAFPSDTIPPVGSDLASGSPPTISPVTDDVEGESHSSSSPAGASDSTLPSGSGDSQDSPSTPIHKQFEGGSRDAPKTVFTTADGEMSLTSIPVASDDEFDDEDPEEEETTEFEYKSEIERARVEGIPLVAPKLYGLDSNGNFDPHVVIKMYNEERDRLARLSKLALDSGIAERQQKLAEFQSKVLAQIVLRVLEHPQLGLDQEQVLRGRQIAAFTFREFDNALSSPRGVSTA